MHQSHVNVETCSTYPLLLQFTDEYSAGWWDLAFTWKSPGIPPCSWRSAPFER